MNNIAAKASASASATQSALAKEQDNLRGREARGRVCATLNGMELDEHKDGGGGGVVWGTPQGLISNLHFLTFIYVFKYVRHSHFPQSVCVSLCVCLCVCVSSGPKAKGRSREIEQLLKVSLEEICWVSGPGNRFPLAASSMATQSGGATKCSTMLPHMSIANAAHAVPAAVAAPT